MQHALPRLENIFSPEANFPPYISWRRMEKRSKKKVLGPWECAHRILEFGILFWVQSQAIQVRSVGLQIAQIFKKIALFNSHNINLMTVVHMSWVLSLLLTCATYFYVAIHPRVRSFLTGGIWRTLGWSWPSPQPCKKRMMWDAMRSQAFLLIFLSNIK